MIPTWLICDLGRDVFPAYTILGYYSLFSRVINYIYCPLKTEYIQVYGNIGCIKQILGKSGETSVIKVMVSELLFY